MNSKLLTINQMILATITLVAILALLFVLVFSAVKLDQLVVTLLSNLISVLTTVLVMQQTHFFKTPDQPGPTGVTTNVQVPPNPTPAPAAGSPAQPPAA